MFEYCSLLSLVVVGTETVDQVVVVQHIHHGDGRVCSAKCVRSEDLAVVVEVESINCVFLISAPSFKDTHNLLGQRRVDLGFSVWRIDPIWISANDHITKESLVHPAVQALE